MGVTFAELVEKLGAIGISEKGECRQQAIPREVFSDVYVGMFASRWSIAVALGLALIIIVGWGVFATGLKLGETKAKNSYHASRYAVHAADQINQTCMFGDPADMVECVTEIIQSTNEDQRAQDDLEAQSKMALWAFWMLIATVVMAGITGAGVIFVWQTLKATQETVQITRKIGEAQSRPLIINRGLRQAELPNCHISGNNYETALSVAISWMNCGNSPATHVSMWKDFVFIPSNGPIPEFTYAESPGRGVIGPGIAVISGDILIFGEEYKMFINRQIELVMYCRADYLDAFSPQNRRHTECTVRLRYQGQIQKQDGTSAPNIEMLTEGPQNTFS